MCLLKQEAVIFTKQTAELAEKLIQTENKLNAREEVFKMQEEVVIMIKHFRTYINWYFPVDRFVKKGKWNWEID